MERKTQGRFMVLMSVVVSLVVIAITGGFYLRTMGKNTEIDASGIKKDEAYSIRNNATPYQKQLYESLKEAMKEESVDKNQVAGLVAQNFVADFYTWTNKFRLNDVGGIQFVYEPIRASVFAKAQSSTYLDLYYYLNNGGLKKTLEVMHVESTDARAVRMFINDEKGEEERVDPLTQKPVKGKTHEAIQVDVKWEYKDSVVLDTQDYESDATITLIENEKGHFVIVEVAEYGD